MLRTLTTVLALIAIVPSARAQSDDERARLHFGSGASDYAAGEYEDALREFQRSYELSQRPELFYNFALCQEHLGNLPAAADALDRFLREVPEIPDRTNLESRLANLRERIAAAGSRTASPEPGSLAEPARPPQASSNVGAVVGFSVAALGLVGVGVFGGLMLGADTTVQSGCGATRSCVPAQLSDVRMWAPLTDVSFGVALAGAAVGLVLLLVGGGSSAPAERAASVSLVPGGLAVSY